MKTKFILLIFLIITAHAADAQIMFQRHYGGQYDDGGSSVLQTDDGGYIVAGRTMSYGNGSNDICILKTDANGNELWSKTYGGNGWDVPYDMKKTHDNCYIITGETSSFGAGASDAFMMKINSNGDSLWIKTYGGSFDDGGWSIKRTLDNGFIIVGYTRSFGIGSGNIYLIKTNETGDTIWTKTFGGETFNTGYSVLQTLDGGFILSGFDMSEDRNMVIIKTDTNGDMIWEKKYEFRAGLSYGTNIIQTVEGGYAVLGTQIDTSNYSNIILLKVNENGDSLFAKTFGGVNNEAGYGLSQTNDNGLVIVGLTQSYGAGGKDVYLIKTDENGIVQWTKTFGGAGDDWGGSVQQTSDNGYIIAGYTKSFSNYYDVYLIKTDENGVSGIEDINSKKESFLVYPNPNNGNMNIEYSIPETESGMFVLIDALGRIVYSKEFEGGKNTINLTLNNLNAGIYYYRAKTESRMIAGDKIIILAK